MPMTHRSGAGTGTIAGSPTDPGEFPHGPLRTPLVATRTPDHLRCVRARLDDRVGRRGPCRHTHDRRGGGPRPWHRRHARWPRDEYGGRRHRRREGAAGGRWAAFTLRWCRHPARGPGRGDGPTDRVDRTGRRDQWMVRLPHPGAGHHRVLAAISGVFPPAFLLSTAVHRFGGRSRSVRPPGHGQPAHARACTDQPGSRAGLA